MHSRRDSAPAKVPGLPLILAGLLATVLLANACAEVASNEAGDGVDRIVAVEAEGATASECAAVLTTRPDGEARCSDSPGCDALAQRPGDAYRWGLGFRDVTTRACAEAYLRAKGVNAESTLDDTWLVLIGRRAEISEILALSGLDFYSITCADRETCCSDLSTCVTNPLCTPIIASRISPDAPCRGPEEIIGCSTSNEVIDSACAGIAPDGACWWIDECELPRGWGGYNFEQILGAPPEVRQRCATEHETVPLCTP